MTKPKTKTLPSIRITDFTDTQMHQAIKKLNTKSIIDVCLQDFRRLCYLYLSKHILENRDIDFKFET